MWSATVSDFAIGCGCERVVNEREAGRPGQPGGSIARASPASWGESAQPASKPVCIKRSCARSGRRSEKRLLCPGQPLPNGMHGAGLRRVLGGQIKSRTPKSRELCLKFRVWPFCRGWFDAPFYPYILYFDHHLDQYMGLLGSFLAFRFGLENVKTDHAIGSAGSLSPYGQQLSPSVVV